MQFNSISDDFFSLCSFDTELLHNKGAKRPYLVVLDLLYKGDTHKFAIPFRSNISSYTDKRQYFSLPIRATTNSGHVHGLHFIKMFPVKDHYLKSFISRDSSHKIVTRFIVKNRDVIKQRAQTYLNKYELGSKLEFCTDIDGIYNRLNACSKVQWD